MQETGTRPSADASGLQAGDRPGSAPPREWLIAASAILALVVTGGGLARFAISSSAPPPLVLSISDETDENPLPKPFEVLVNGRPMAVRFVGDTARVVAAGAFDGTAAATIVLLVPERAEFTVTRDGESGHDGTRTSSATIDDDTVVMRGTGRRFDRANPTADAEHAAREAEVDARREERERLSAERRRVQDGLFSIEAQRAAAEVRQGEIWAGRDTAPYDEIAAVTTGEVLPMIDTALLQLDNLTSGDTLAQGAIAAERACVVAYRDAFVRNASFDPNLSPEENESQITAAWNATAGPCFDAIEKWDALG